jgi:transposase-like protein
MSVDQDQRESSPARDAVNDMIEAGLLDRLMARVDGEGLALTSEGGFLPQMVKAVLERGLRAELSDHLGYEKAIRPAVVARTRGTGRRPRRC